MTDLDEHALRAALSAGAEQIRASGLRPDGEVRLRAALDGDRPAPAVTLRRRRWLPLAAAAAVLTIAGGAGTAVVLQRSGADGPASGRGAIGRPQTSRPTAGLPTAGLPTVSPTAVPGDGTADSWDGAAARVLAAHGVHQCAEAVTRSQVPARGHVRAAYRCTWSDQDEAAPGEGSFRRAVALRVTGGLDDVVKLAEQAYGLPRPTLGEDQACSLVGYLTQELWVTMDDGQVVRWQVPWYPSPCGGPNAAEERAWQGLRTELAAVARGDRVASALALATGCPDEIKNTLVLESRSRATGSAPPATPSVDGDASACFYRAGADGVATLQAATRLDVADAQPLAAQVGQSVQDSTCAAGGNGVVALLQGFTVPGHDSSVLVDLDGCSVAAGYAGGWWRAPQALRDALVQVQATAVRAQAPSKP